MYTSEFWATCLIKKEFNGNKLSNFIICNEKDVMQLESAMCTTHDLCHCYIRLMSLMTKLKRIWCTSESLTYH